jgi:6-pyruvoyl-tetrahydropterin synthase
VEATAVGNVDINDRLGSDQGMVVDFGDLKQVMVECIHDVYDHGAIFYRNDPNIVLWQLLKDAHSMNVHFIDRIPTAENLAELFFFRCWQHELHIGQTAWTLIEMAVWETPTSVAVYKPS